jgi:hypothetical protein
MYSVISEEFGVSWRFEMKHNLTEYNLKVPVLNQKIEIISYSLTIVNTNIPIDHIIHFNSFIWNINSIHFVSMFVQRYSIIIVNAM